jgi:hypothetical protein
VACLGGGIRQGYELGSEQSANRCAKIAQLMTAECQRRSPAEVCAQLPAMIQKLLIAQKED